MNEIFMISILLLLGVFIFLIVINKISYICTLIITTVLYVTSNIAVFLYDKYLDYDLNTYDLDKDGMFNILEQTVEQKEAFNKVIWDVGRNFYPLTSFIYFFLLLMPVMLLIVFIIKRIQLYKLKRQKIIT